MGVAAFIFCLIYAALLVQAIFGEAGVPGGSVPVAYSLLHGGAASVEVPPIPELFGIGGDLQLGLPLLSFALLPFLAFLIGGRIISSRASSALFLSAAAALSYGVIVGVVAALSGVTINTGGATISLSVAPFSAALWAALLALLGVAIGVAVTRGPWMPAWARQATRGAILATGVSLAGILLISAVVALVPQGGGEDGAGAPAQSSPGNLVPPEMSETPVPGGEGQAPGGVNTGGGDGAAVLAGIGMFFALLPAMLGTLWLVAHGLPVGVQNIPDLSQLPMVGQELTNLPLKVSLIGNWPLGAEWKALLIAPVAGLIVGGLISARGAAGSERWWRGALVALPYTAIAFVAAIATGITASASLMNVEVSAALRASLPWLLVLLPVGAGLGALGGLLARGESRQPRPQWAFRAATGASAILLLGSLPLLAAPLAFSAAQNQEFSQAPGPPPTTPGSSQAEENPSEGGSANSEIQVSDTSPGDSPASAFDDLLPVLQERTEAPIMLPATLPQGLENVAVDADREGEEYGILFLGQPTGNTVETFVGANSVGTFTATPEPESNPTNEFFEATRTEEIELPDGTPATLRRMEPTGTPANQGPYWEGTFEREGYTYTLTIELPDTSGDVAGRTLSSMVLADSADQGSEEPVGSRADLEQAVGDYYRAAGSKDWDYTYEYLDSETRSMFTEEEWRQKNQYFADLDETIYHVVSVNLDETSEEPIAEVQVRLTGEDGSSRVRTTYFVWEDGAWRHRFAQEEIDLFRPDLTYEEFLEVR